MRWYWIDRFLEFESRQRALAVKTISLSENHMWDHCPGYPVMPPPLIIEGIAQTAGILVGEVYDFREKVILAKVGKATFHRLARPGDVLEYSVTIKDVQPHGAIIGGQSHVGGELQAEVDIVFAHLDDRFAKTDLFRANDFTLCSGSSAYLRSVANRMVRRYCHLPIYWKPNRDGWMAPPNRSGIAHPLLPLREQL